MIFKVWDRKPKFRKPLRFDEPRKKRSALGGVGPKLKQIAYDRLAVLREYNRRLREAKSPKSKGKLLDNFLSELNSGLLSPAGGKLFSHIGRSTIYNWQKRYKNGGLAALVPRYKTKSTAIAKDSKAIFRPLRSPFKMKFPGPPKRNGKAFFIERVKRRWKHNPVDFPIKVGLFYTMPVPKKISMEMRMAILKRKFIHITSPHLDALNAFVINCLEEIVFKHHSQIVQLYTEKKFGWWPQTIILIEQA